MGFGCAEMGDEKLKVKSSNLQKNKKSLVKEKKDDMLFNLISFFLKNISSVNPSKSLSTTSITSEVFSNNFDGDL